MKLIESRTSELAINPINMAQGTVAKSAMNRLKVTLPRSDAILLVQMLHLQ